MISHIKESLDTNDIIGLVIPDIEYEERLVDVACTVCKDYNKILYISVNKPYEKLISKFKQNKVDINRFYVIDCITRTAKDAPSTENCIYISSPRALDEIQTTILDVLREQRIDLVLIDSPSSLLTYYEDMDVLKFMHLLTTKLIIAECKGIIPFPKESCGPLKRSIEMFIDDTVFLSGGNGSSNAKSSLNLSVRFDKIILLLRKISWNIQVRLTGIKNELNIKIWG